MESTLEVPMRSKIGPLPYFPQLCRVLGGVTISIVLVYLEIHHSPPEAEAGTLPARAGLRTPPVSLDCDQACEDLGVSRRTLHTALDSLGVWWRAEQQRSGAARSGRDFLNSKQSFPASSHSLVRPYAIVGPRDWNQPRTLVIHRNPTRLERILIDAGISRPYDSYLNCGTYSDTPQASQVADSVLDVLGKALNLGPVKGGNAWGWGQKRVKEHSERMTRLWAERRERAVKAGKTTM